MEKRTVIHLRIPEELKKEFDQICDKKHINKSALIRSWVEDFIKTEK